MAEKTTIVDRPDEVEVEKTPPESPGPGDPEAPADDAPAPEDEPDRKTAALAHG